jgi:hypothetical protein
MAWDWRLVDGREELGVRRPTRLRMLAGADQTNHLRQLAIDSLKKGGAEFELRASAFYRVSVLKFPSCSVAISDAGEGEEG